MEFLAPGTEKGAALVDNGTFNAAFTTRTLGPLAVSDLKLEMSPTLDALGANIGLGTGAFITNALFQDLPDGGMEALDLRFPEGVGRLQGMDPGGE